MTTKKNLKKAILTHGNYCSFANLWTEIPAAFRGVLGIFRGIFAIFICLFYYISRNPWRCSEEPRWETLLWYWSFRELDKKRLTPHLKLFIAPHYVCRWWICCSVSSPVWLCRWWICCSVSSPVWLCRWWICCSVSWPVWLWS